MKGGMALCTVAGMISSMTGVGGGAIKVPLMNIYMHVPMKAASATSSYMIGITAFSGAITYFLGGQVLLGYAAGVAIGAFLGSLMGTALARRINGKHLRKYFSAVLYRDARTDHLAVPWSDRVVRIPPVREGLDLGHRGGDIDRDNHDRHPDESLTEKPLQQPLQGLNRTRSPKWRNRNF